MTKFPFKIRHRNQLVDVGHIAADSERKGLELLLREKEFKGAGWSVQVGGTLVSFDEEDVSRLSGAIGNKDAKDETGITDLVPSDLRKKLEEQRKQKELEAALGGERTVGVDPAMGDLTRPQMATVCHVCGGSGRLGYHGAQDPKGPVACHKCKGKGHVLLNIQKMPPLGRTLNRPFLGNIAKEHGSYGGPAGWCTTCAGGGVALGAGGEPEPCRDCHGSGRSLPHGLNAIRERFERDLGNVPGRDAVGSNPIDPNNPERARAKACVEAYRQAYLGGASNAELNEIQKRFGATVQIQASWDHKTHITAVVGSWKFGTTFSDKELMDSARGRQMGLGALPPRNRGDGNIKPRKRRG